jgi:hypothetical protein
VASAANTTITLLRSNVTVGDLNLTASVPQQDGASFAWTLPAGLTLVGPVRGGSPERAA